MMPLSLYIHIPWCTTRCGYCDFNTYVTDTTDPRNTAGYIEALRREISLAASTVGERWVTTVYFGGGTPTLMDPVDMGRILASVRRHFDLDDSAEITTEANPETLTPHTLEDLRGIGINRLSLGMQSAVPHVLATLDRVHSPGRALEAVGWARKAGFESVSLDLIYGTPGESMEDWETSLVSAMSVKPDHISAYSLIIEEGTPLAKRMRAGEVPYPDDDSLADKYILADKLLSSGGLGWYEVSNWSKPGRECKHNMAYWRSFDWWGVGAGAHSHIDGTRWWNVKRPRKYAQSLSDGQSPMLGQEQLTDEEKHEEKLMLRLRMAEGLSLADLTDAEYERAERNISTGRLVVRGSRIMCTLAGRLVVDGIVRDILTAAPRVANRGAPVRTSDRRNPYASVQVQPSSDGHREETRNIEPTMLDTEVPWSRP